MHNSLKILVTGAHGQLGTALTHVMTSSKHEVTLVGSQDLDITDAGAVNTYFLNHKFDFIVNCAAFTKVDNAEDEVEQAHLVNCQGVANLATVAQAQGARIIHISTDYVFDGNHCVPYTENDSPAPASVYGASKLAGEKVLFELAPQSVVLRTSWLYSSTGSNFVKTMLRLGRERGEVKVVYDQVGSPTYAPDLANAICQIIDSDEIPAGIYNYTNEGVTSWYDFAKTIFRLSGVDCDVIPVLSTQYRTLATRPHYSVLDKAKIKNTFHVHIPHWEDSLTECINNILKDN